MIPRQWHAGLYHSLLELVFSGITDTLMASYAMYAFLQCEMSVESAKSVEAENGKSGLDAEDCSLMLSRLTFGICMIISMRIVVISI